jgi:hypothetical protein
MALPAISGRKWIYALVAALLVSVLARPHAQADVSGIVSYLYEPNPSEIKPKMYNWEITLNQADSHNGAYEIIQMTRPTGATAKAADVVPQVLVESKVITPGQDGVVRFNLYVGDKTPKENMGRRGHSGQPIIFSGIGTGSSASSWIVFPGARIERAVPSPRGTPLVNGKLSLIQFIVKDDRGEQFQTDVILVRK